MNRSSHRNHFGLCPESAVRDRRSARLLQLLRREVAEVKESHNLLLLKTRPGGAAKLAGPAERQWPHVMCAVAGRDLLLLVTATRSTCDELGRMVRELMS